MISKVEISHRTIFFTLAVLASIWLLLQIHDILFIVFVSFIFMSALRPLVEGLEKIRIPRVISILAVYGALISIVSVAFAGFIPSLMMQTARLAQELPGFVARVMPYWDIDIRSITQQLAPIGENVFKVTLGIFSNLATLLTILVITFYFLFERRFTRGFLEQTLGKNIATQWIDFIERVENRLGAWVLGQCILMVVVGISVYIGLTLLGIEYALPLAIFAGILEIVPVIGPLLSAIPAILVGFAASPFVALYVAALYLVIQQAENNIFVPFVMRRSVGFSPLVTILSLMIGGKLGGIAGAILAVPVVLVLQELLGAYLRKGTSKE